jgi:hypothetical protein
LGWSRYAAIGFQGMVAWSKKSAGRTVSQTCPLFNADEFQKGTKQPAP